jgi:hypothetical protein
LHNVIVSCTEFNKSADTVAGSNIINRL